MCVGLLALQVCEERGLEQLEQIRAVRHRLEGHVMDAQVSITHLTAAQPPSTPLKTSSSVTPTKTGSSASQGHARLGLMPPTPSGVLDLAGRPARSVSSPVAVGRQVGWHERGPSVHEVRASVRAVATGDDGWEMEGAGGGSGHGLGSPAWASPGQGRGVSMGGESETSPVLRHRVLFLGRPMEGGLAGDVSEVEASVSAVATGDVSEVEAARTGQIFRVHVPGHASPPTVGDGAYQRDRGRALEEEGDEEDGDDGDEAVQELRRRMQSLREKISTPQKQRQQQQVGNSGGAHDGLQPRLVDVGRPSPVVTTASPESRRRQRAEDAAADAVADLALRDDDDEEEADARLRHAERGYRGEAWSAVSPAAPFKARDSPSKQVPPPRREGAAAPPRVSDHSRPSSADASSRPVTGERHASPITDRAFSRQIEAEDGLGGFPIPLPDKSQPLLLPRLHPHISSTCLGPSSSPPGRPTSWMCNAPC